MVFRISFNSNISTFFFFFFFDWNSEGFFLFYVSKYHLSSCAYALSIHTSDHLTSNYSVASDTLWLLLCVFFWLSFALCENFSRWLRDNTIIQQHFYANAIVCFALLRSLFFFFFVPHLLKWIHGKFWLLVLVYNLLRNVWTLKVVKSQHENNDIVLVCLFLSKSQTTTTTKN